MSYKPRGFITFHRSKRLIHYDQWNWYARVHKKEGKDVCDKNNGELYICAAYPPSLSSVRMMRLWVVSWRVHLLVTVELALAGMTNSMDLYSLSTSSSWTASGLMRYCVEETHLHWFLFNALGQNVRDDACQISISIACTSCLILAQIAAKSTETLTILVQTLNVQWPYDFILGSIWNIKYANFKATSPFSIFIIQWRWSGR